MTDSSKEPIVKSFNVKDKVFMANGRKYYMSEKISVRRFREYEKLVPLLTYGMGFNEIFSALKKAYAAANEKRFADVAVMLHNIMSGIKDADDEKRFHPALLVCALVINREGEDPGAYDESVQIEKIEDWQKEGLNMLDFFTLALTSINGFRETYLQYIAQQAKDLIEKSDLIQKKVETK